MSESISIPSVNNKYGTTELVEGLMKVERVPLERAKAEKEQYQTEQKVWNEVGQRLSKLRDTARELYSFNNPFNERLAESANEEALTATATREASFENIKIKINQLAGSDRFISKPVPKNYQVEKGTYTFLVGDSKVEFSWKGGTIKDFADALNRRGNNLIKASLIGISKDEQSFLVESLKTGKSQTLDFKNKALDFALDIGVVEKVKTQKGSYNDTTVNETQTTTIPFSPTLKKSDNVTLSFNVSVITRDSDSIQQEPVGPNIPSAGGIDFKGIAVQNSPVEIPLDKWTPPIAPPRVDNLNVLYVKTSLGAEIPLGIIEDGMTNKNFTISTTELGDIQSLIVKNTNTHRTIKITDIQAYDANSSRGIRPINPVDSAKDAIITYEGIKMNRETNDVDDVIPGVTLHLHEPTEKTISLNIVPDKETAKNGIINFVANYNRVMVDLNILTQTNPSIIKEIEYFTSDEISEAEKRLGMLQGDFTLNNIKTSLQTATTNAYKANDDTTIQILQQIGISTSAGTYSGINQSKLRGYLEIDEKKLDEVLSNDIIQIQNLFGFDSDGDLIVDNGVGFTLDSRIKPYVQTAGLLTMKTDTLKSKIDSTEKKIQNLDKQLAKKEQELKTKYGNMEGTLNSLNQQSTRLEQQLNSGNKN